MVLSHCRKEAVVWSRSTDQLAWHQVHNQAYRRLGGVAAVNRIDNLKTGIARGCGAWGQVNAQYRTSAKALGFHVDGPEGAKLSPGAIWPSLSWTFPKTRLGASRRAGRSPCFVGLRSGNFPEEG
jgi:hypothetical protein